MSRVNDFKRLFREGFRESPRWLDWFASAVFRDEDFTVVEEDGHAASGLLTTPYATDFHGTELRLGYISCVATERARRGRGLMHTLMHRALTDAHARGMALTALIPASRPLFFLYDRLDFSTVYYVDELRYVSAHIFEADASYRPAEPTYETFARLEAATPGCVRHSRAQYDAVLTDLAMDGGHVLAVEGPGGTAAMAFVHVGDVLTVKYLPYSAPAARETVLAAVHALDPEKGIVVWDAPGPRRPAMRARGMARITDALQILSALAASDHTIDQTIRLHDPLIPANDAVFVLHSGRCERLESTMRHITLDVSVSVLARILFNSPEIGSVFGLPALRPQLPLMLD